MVYFYRIEDLPQAIEIGYTGEHNINTIQIDYSTWAESMDHCYPSVVCVRPGETMEDAYVAATTYDHNVLSWSIASSDLGDTEGTGLAQVWLEEVENASVNKSGRSAVFATIVRQSVDGGRITPPQQLPFLEQMTLLKTQTIIAHDEVIDIRISVDGIKETLDEAMETINGAIADTAEYASSAQTAASTASADAESATGSANIASSSAESAASSATSASESETNAAASATSAANSATAAYGYQQTTAGYVNTVQTESAAAQGWATGGSGGTPSPTNNAKAYALDSEAYALGTRGGEPVSEDDDTYQNNSKYWAEQAAEAASVIDDTSTSQSKIWSAYKTNSEVQDLKDRVSDLEYVEVVINSLSVSPSLAEVGSTVASATLTYSMNRDATQMKLDGNVIENTSKTGTISLSSLSLTSNKTWTLQATDERLSQESEWVSKTATLTFTNKVLYGVASIPGSLNDTFLNGLATRTLSTGKVRSFNVNAGSGQYIWYALPSSYGTCTFTVGGFTGGFSLVATQNHTNESGSTVEYRIYRSDNANLGSVSVSVS